MVQLEQYEPTALVLTDADPNVEVNIAKHCALCFLLLVCYICYSFQLFSTLFVTFLF